MLHRIHMVLFSQPVSTVLEDVAGFVIQRIHSKKAALGYVYTLGRETRHSAI